MKRNLTPALAALALGFGVASATAQTVVIQPEQETIIREYITSAPPPPVDPGIDFDITVGSIVPDTVEVHALEVPEIEADYDYVVVEDRTVLVEPETRKIIHVIE